MSWSVMSGAGMSLQQAQVLAELFSGKAGLLASPAACNMAELQAFYHRWAASQQSVPCKTEKIAKLVFLV